MRIIKTILAFSTVLLVVFTSTEKVFAQQDPTYTQYMDNFVVINPGYAGSREVGNATLFARNQWVTFDGAPVTRSLTYNTSIEGKNIGFGFSLMSDEIGPLKHTGVYIDYSYFLKVSENFKLGMGLKAGVSFYRASLTDLETIDLDPIFENDIYENFLPNVGVGFYLYSDRTYFGLSVPRLIENTITRDYVSTTYVNQQQLHLYFAGGHRFQLNSDYQLKTNIMFKWVNNAPVSVDINAVAGFREKIWVGAMYRFDSAFGIIAQFKPNPSITIGYSYDMATSAINGFDNGTHEIMLSFNIDLFQRKQIRETIVKINQ
jgi:type IX secretion system PorP/SprF family membrane protein